MSAFASAALPPATIYDSKQDSPTLGNEVSDAADDDTTVINGNTSGEGNKNKDDDNGETLDDVFFAWPGTS